MTEIPHGWVQAARLPNLGATCYLNSTLQALVHTAPLAQELLTDRPVAGNGREAIVLRLMQQHVRDCIGGGNPYVKPGRLLQVLHKLNPRQAFHCGRPGFSLLPSNDAFKQSMNDENFHCRAVWHLSQDAC